MEDKGGPRGVGIALVAAMASALCVAAATAASESSSLTEALGPKLEPLDPVMFWASPFGGLGLLLWVSPPPPGAVRPPGFGPTPVGVPRATPTAIPRQAGLARVGASLLGELGSGYRASAPSSRPAGRAPARGCTRTCVTYIIYVRWARGGPAAALARAVLRSR